MKKQHALALAKQFREALENANIPFESVILFGSYARGDATEHSDIDLAVIGPAFLDTRTSEMIAVRKLRRPISYKLSPLWFRKGYLDNKYSTLAGEILKEGLMV